MIEAVKTPESRSNDSRREAGHLSRLKRKVDACCQECDVDFIVPA